MQPTLQRHEKAIAFGIAAAAFIALHAWRDIRAFRFDAFIYWALADLSSPSHLTHNIRGYVLEVLLAPARWSSDALVSLWPFRLLASLVYAGGLTSLLPAVYVRLFGGHLTLARRLVVPLLVMVLFPGLLLYPLSDLPALLMMAGALLAAHAGIERQAERPASLRWIALAGALAACAYNTRTIYLFTGLGLALLLVAALQGKARKLLAALVFSAGAAAVLLPQVVINERLHGQMTANPTLRADGVSIFAWQLVVGLRLQRYETMVLEDKGLGRSVRYEDPAGIRLEGLLAQEGPIHSVRDYAAAMLRHPLEFSGLIVRHFLNGMDLRDGMLYTSRFSESRNGIALLNFLVLALSAWVAWLARCPAAAHRPWWLALWVAPVLAVIPGAVETRFFAPLYVLAWCTLAFHLDRAALAASLRRHWVLIPAALLAAGSVFFAITLATMASRV